MKILILTLLPFILFAQSHILVDSTQANFIKGRYGVYFEIDPIRTFGGKFIVPTACLNDVDLVQAKSKLLQVNQVNVGIKPLPSIGQSVYKDSLYTSENGVVKCRQTHSRTIYPPNQTPALFSFFRENSDTLSWIENEEVKVGWKRVYLRITYICLQSHQTLSTWTPDVTPALWQREGGGAACPDWVQPTGAHDAYAKDACVTFNGKEYLSNIDANVWSPTVYPAGWRLK